MTTSELLGVLRRRWLVVVLGTAMLMVAIHAVASRPGVYTTQVDVVFLAPASARYPNVIEQSSRSLVAVAGLIEREVNEGYEEPATASASTTLASKGVRDGYAIRLPNSGGQWADNFDRPVIDIQVVGPTESAVRTKVSVLVSDIKRTLAARQVADGVQPVNRIKASSAPTTAAVSYLDGHSGKAIAVTLLLGGVLIPIGAVAADRLLNTYQRRRRTVVKISSPGRLA